MKKIGLMALSLVLVAVLAIGGTLAYLTDTDAEINVMTVGKVTVDLIEQQRSNGADSELEQFEDYKGLTPLVGSAQGAKDKWGMPAEAKNYVDKIVSAENTGSNDAYMRILVAVPAALDTDDASKNALHWNLGNRFDEDGNSAYNTGEWAVAGNPFFEDFGNGPVGSVSPVRINGVDYNVYDFTVQHVVKPHEETAAAITGFYLDKNVNYNDEMGCYTLNGEKINFDFSNGVQIPVLVQAVQADGFDAANIAFDEAFGAFTAANATVWFGGEVEKEEVSGNNKAALVAAINAAQPGDTVVLTEDTTIAGYAATEKLIIEKAITLDLNGKTLTTESGWGGIDLKGGASIVNGTINHVGNTAAIKAFEVEKIENVVINVTETAGKIKGGIVVQNQAGNYVGSIKNVTINGATNGIECYRSTNDPAIGIMENVTINATDNGIYLNGAGKIGSISNCDIYGGNIGINAYLANLWHIALDIEDSAISGGVSGIDIWDEAAINTGSTVTFDYDSATTFTGGTNNIKVTLQDEITCTINGADVATPCDIRQ